MIAWAADAIYEFTWAGLALYLPVAATFGAFGWWGAYTWQQLWRNGQGKWERLVFNYGVRRFGLATTLSFMVILGCFGAASGDGRVDSLRWLVGGVYFGAVFGLPVGLHTGYFWGVACAKVMGIKKS